MTAVLGSLAAGLPGADEAPKEKVLFEEPFTGELGKDCSWVREDAGAWRLDRGALVLRTLPGYLHAGPTNSRYVLLRPLPRSDRPPTVEVHVERKRSPLTAQLQSARVGPVSRQRRGVPGGSATWETTMRWARTTSSLM